MCNRCSSLLLSLVFIVISCQENRPLFDNQESSVALNNGSHIIPEAQALSVLDEFIPLLSDDVRSETKKKKIESFYLKDNRSRSGSCEEEETLPVYVFNFEDNGGFAIIAADSRIPFPLCLTDQGSLPEDQDFALPGPDIALSIIDTDLKMYLGLPIKNADGECFSAEDYGNVSDFSTRSNHIYVPGRYYQAGSWGSILPCRWGQDIPFNDYCFLPDRPTPRAKAGCLPIAVGQIMYYWGKSCYYNGTYYDWNIMREVEDMDSVCETDGAMDLVARFVSALGDTSNLNAQYTISDTGILHTYAKTDSIPTTFNHFGFDEVGLQQNFNDFVLMNTLDDGPALVWGYSLKSVDPTTGEDIYAKGHAWVVDKMLELDPIPPLGGGLSMDPILFYTHCNWGWNGTYNGYFLKGIFDATHPLTPPDQGSGAPSGEYTPYYYQYSVKMNAGIKANSN